MWQQQFADALLQPDRLVDVEIDPALLRPGDHLFDHCSDVADVVQMHSSFAVVVTYEDGTREALGRERRVMVTNRASTFPR